jgi:hypothetical protein
MTHRIGDIVEHRHGPEPYERGRVVGLGHRVLEVQWDVYPETTVEDDDDEKLVVVGHRGPGIGAVVAMVAAARMVLGGWSAVLRRRESPVTHWDVVPAWMTNGALPACGDYWPFDHGIASGIEDADCPDCLAIARRAGVLP